ncbi:gamma-glutamyl-gamma-aminobutyrate hydrolase family protein [Streptomyces sp. ODS28]|uniref:glutamine amidotransferase-related protein n=1 Tax=Streptomyces sp. ODS28 TaxID=3136688 RepID=UPI0031ED6F52
MRALVVDNGSPSAGLICQRLWELGAETEIVAFRNAPCRLTSRHQALVLSGTKVPADSGAYARLTALIDRCDLPVLGLCGGMHILGLAHGGRLVEGDQRVGAHHVRLDPRESLFRHVGSRASLFQRHTRYLREVPTVFRVIGRAADCPVEFIRSTDGRLIGAQAHLEFRRDGRRILRGFLEYAARYGAQTHHATRPAHQGAHQALPHPGP